MRYAVVQLALCIAAANLQWSSGCSTSAPPSSSKGSGSGDRAESAAELKDNADDIAALKAVKATLKMDSAGHVTEVELDRTNADKELAHLKGLPNVRVLNCTEALGVTDKGLALLEGLPSLRVLKLERTGVTDAGMPHLQKIPNLEELDVRRLGITFTGYREIGKLVGLKRLFVVYNSQNFTDDCLLAIKGLKNLERLDMQDCNLPTEKGLAVLQGFPKLRNVRMYGPNVTDKVLTYLRPAKDLRVLSLAQCSSITVAGFDEIKEFKNLTELVLYGALQTTDAAVAKLTGLSKLQTLELRSTPISSLALSYLKDLKGLKLLDLEETAAVGNEGLEHIQDLVSLEDLNLKSCQIDDNGLAFLKNLTNLKRLNLDHCTIGDEGLRHLAALKNLEFLHVGDTQVTDEGLEHLYELKKLNHLVVEHLPGVTEEGIEALKKHLPQLKDIEH